jgi:hypothetical protein
MTRDKDDKMGGPDADNSYDSKVERRFTKEARAKLQEGHKGTTPPNVGKSHADDGGGNKS